tara:strand:+ start:2649 stop:3281 length:633 start_codon:yes stop_codon:yes gene_type:complete
MKITIEHYEEIFTYESTHDSMGMTDLTDKLYGLCIAAGYHPDSVGECFFEKGREMTEHLYPDDPQEAEVNFDSAELRDRYDRIESNWASVPAHSSWAGSPTEDVVSSGVSDPIQGEKTISVKSRYGDARKFTIIAKNCVEYSFEDDGHTGCSFQEDGSLESVDPSGGPYICLGTNLGEVHKELEGLTVTEILHNKFKMPGMNGSYYFTVK